MSTESSAVEDRVVPGAEGADNGAVAREQDKGAPATGETAGSPDAGNSGAKGPATPLEAVKAALKVEPAADSPPQGNKPGPAVDATGTKPAAATDETDKTLPFHNHPRWKEVTTAKKALEGTVAEMTPKAQRMDMFDAKLRETGMDGEYIQPLFEGGAQLKRAGATTEEVGNLMKVGAALKLGDRQVIQSIAGPAFAAVGLKLVEELPADILEMVEKGEISEEAGHKMAGLKFTAHAESARRGIAETVVTSREQEEAASRREKGFELASASWESRVKPGDADWSRKEPFIVEGIKSLLKLRRPTSDQEVVQICQDAYDQVTRIMKGSGTVRPSVTPAGGGSTTTVKAVPKTALEATKMALGRD